MTNTIIQLAEQYATKPSTGGYQHVYEVVKILAIFGGALTGGYFSHRFLLKRDIKLRQGLFLAFMTQLKGVVLHVWPGPDFNVHYRNTIPNIGHASAPVLWDLKGEKGVEFYRLINALCGYGDKAVENQKKILEDIDAITRLFDT